MSRQDERMAQLECENENLQHRIAVLEDLLKRLEENRSIPQRNSWRVPQWSINACERCPTCKIELNSVMSYSCTHSDCPCGLGSPQC